MEELDGERKEAGSVCFVCGLCPVAVSLRETDGVLASGSCLRSQTTLAGALGPISKVGQVGPVERGDSHIL